MHHTVTLVRDKLTKNTVRYVEEGGGGQMIYIPKAVSAALGDPPRITLTIAAAAALAVAA
jgi:hypothetical protein